MRSIVKIFISALLFVTILTSCDGNTDTTVSLPENIFDAATQSAKTESRINELNDGSWLNQYKDRKMTELEIDYDFWTPEEIEYYNQYKTAWEDCRAFLLEVEELFKTDPSNEEKALELKKRIDERSEEYRNETTYIEWYNSLSEEEKEERKEVYELLAGKSAVFFGSLSNMLSTSDEFFKVHWNGTRGEIEVYYMQSKDAGKHKSAKQILQSLNQLDEVMRLYENGDITAEQGSCAVDYIWGNCPRYGN